MAFGCAAGAYVGLLSQPQARVGLLVVAVAVALIQRASRGGSAELWRLGPGKRRVVLAQVLRGRPPRTWGSEPRFAP
jgi:hypothetical protein